MVTVGLEHRVVSTRDHILIHRHAQVQVLPIGYHYPCNHAPNLIRIRIERVYTTTSRICTHEKALLMLDHLLRLLVVKFECRKARVYNLVYMLLAVSMTLWLQLQGCTMCIDTQLTQCLACFGRLDLSRRPFLILSSAGNGNRISNSSKDCEVEAK